uniref:GntR family transcriptional regulator n=1 Tax=Thermofilum pendens TaxID=2269 RepID=A0A7C4FDJ0_THEPE
MSTGSSEDSRSRVSLEVLLYLYLSGGYVGRAKLAEELGVGEGTVRGVLSRLSDLGLVERARAGARLSKRGVVLVEELLGERHVSKVSLEPVEELEGGLAVVAVVGYCRNPGAAVLKIRDAAVRGGAAGAVIAVSEGGLLKLPPGGEDMCTYLREICGKLARLKAREGVAVIVIFGERVGRLVKGFLEVLRSPHYELMISRTTPGSSSIE